VSFAELASANIVGYTTTDTAKNAQQMIGASFVSVSGTGESLSLTDISLQNDEEEGSSWIKWWDPTAKKYSDKVCFVYERYDADDDEKVYEGGWADEDWIPVEKTFAPGEGFWFQAGNDGVKILVSGQVYQPTTQYLSLPLVKNAQRMVQNPFPTTLKLSDIVLDNDEEEGSSWIKWWDPTTKKYSDKVCYVYERYDAEDDDKVYEGGWADEDWIPVEKTFDAGAGFWVQAGNEGVEISFPNPFYTPAN
jgi:hypothetical protein